MTQPYEPIAMSQHVTPAAAALSAARASLARVKEATAMVRELKAAIAEAEAALETAEAEFTEAVDDAGTLVAAWGDAERDAITAREDRVQEVLWALDADDAASVAALDALTL